jgi:hypothetical protein
LPDIRVFIRNLKGEYLGGCADQWYFTNSPTNALVLSYRSDLVPEQIEALRQAHGIQLIADPVPPEEIYETCDLCQELFSPSMIFFDGKRFRCMDCLRRKRAPR